MAKINAVDLENKIYEYLVNEVDLPKTKESRFLYRETLSDIIENIEVRIDELKGVKQ